MTCASISPLTPQGTWTCSLDDGHDGSHESVVGNQIWDGDDPIDRDLLVQLLQALNEDDPFYPHGIPA